MRTLWYAGLLWLAGIVLFACQSGDLNVGQSVINPQELVVQSVDSVTIQTSTVMRTDSFLTSGPTEPDIVTGYWSDALTGRLTAQCFTAVDYPSNSLVSQTNFRLDSLVLELGYSFAYGDTTSAFNLNVHRLNRPLQAQPYYSTNTAAYEAEPYIQRTFVPRPASGTRIMKIRVPNDLTQNLYDRLISGTITDNISLNEFLPGFAFVGKSTTNALVGFTTNPTVSGLRLYYHDTDLNRTPFTLLFPITGIHFTQLQNDRTGTPLAALKSRSDAVSSRLTDRTTFVSLGTGLQTRLEFPYLNEFFRPEKFADLNKALLIISPVRRDLRDNIQPPSSLQLYRTNNQNEFLGQIPGGPTGGEAAGGIYFADPVSILLNDSYTIDLTYYIGQIIKKKALSQPLLLTAPFSSDQNNSSTLRTLLQRVTIGDNLRPNDQMQLKLFMTSGT